MVEGTGLAIPQLDPLALRTRPTGPVNVTVIVVEGGVSCEEGCSAVVGAKHSTVPEE